MESGLAFIKLFAVAGFIALGIMIISGIIGSSPAAGLGALKQEALFPGGVGGIAGSMLIVMFTYAGFEIIGLAASETGEPHKVVPRAILYTVIALVGLFMGFVLPDQVYLFLVSSGGFSLLFTYLIIMLTHLRFRRRCGCPPAGNCQLPGFPYTSLAAIISIIAIILSMPLVEGQQYGLIAGAALVLLYTVIYLIKKRIDKRSRIQQ